MIKCHKDQCLCPSVLASGYDSVQYDYNIDYNNNAIIRSITFLSKDNDIKSIPIRFNITIFMNYNIISRTNSLEYHKIRTVLDNNQYINVIMMGYRQRIHHKN